MVEGLGGSFTAIDWAIVAGSLVLATLIGGPLAGKQATIRDFFLAGRKLPWWVIAGSIISTEVSAVTLISVPWAVYQPGGNLAYLQLGLIGMVIARLIVAWVLVPAYLEREIYSPYDYMGARLGPRVRSMVTALFTLGSLLAQSARFYVTAVVLEIILHDELSGLAASTGIPTLWWAVAVLALVAFAWTYFGGMATVIWTDFVTFLVFTAAGVVALLTVARHLDGGFDLLLEVGRGARKMRFFDFDTSLAKPYTFWTALFAATWIGVGAFGTDQLMAQRLFCCRSVRDARLAIVASSVGVCVAILFAFVGIGLFAYYERHPLEGVALALFQENGDRVFPIFLMQVVSTGVKGVIVAGIFAAAISGIDSIMAALAQTTLSAVYLPRRARFLERRGRPATPEERAAEERRSVRIARVLVVVFGVLLSALAVLMDDARERYGSILDLAMSMSGYTQGALLACFVLAFLRLPVDDSGFLWSAPLSAMAVFALAWHESWSVEACTVFVWGYLGLWILLRVLPDLRAGRTRGLLAQTVFLVAGLALLAWLSRHGLVRVPAEIEGDAAWVEATVAWPWFVPVGCTVAFVLGILLARPAERAAPS